MTNLRAISIIIKNTLTNELLEYKNLTEAAKALNVSRTAVKKALDLQRPLLKMATWLQKIKYLNS